MYYTLFKSESGKIKANLFTIVELYLFIIFEINFGPWDPCSCIAIKCATTNAAKTTKY